MHEILSSYAYQVFFNGEPGAGFVDCGGLENAAVLATTRQLSLHAGAIVTREFFDWVMQHSAPHSLRLAQLDETGKERRHWDLLGARVTKVTATTFTGTGFPFRVEALELAVEGVVVS